MGREAEAVRVTRSVVVDAPRQQVWDLVATWEQRRTLEDVGEDRTRVTEELRVVPPVPLPAQARAVLRRVLDALFAHRHRRLRAGLGAAGVREGAH